MLVPVIVGGACQAFLPKKKNRMVIRLWVDALVVVGNHINRLSPELF